MLLLIKWCYKLLNCWVCLVFPLDCIHCKYQYTVWGSKPGLVDKRLSGRLSHTVWELHRTGHEYCFFIRKQLLAVVLSEWGLGCSTNSGCVKVSLIIECVVSSFENGLLTKQKPKISKGKKIILKEFHWAGPHVMKQGCVKQSSSVLAWPKSKKTKQKTTHRRFKSKKHNFI